MNRHMLRTLVVLAAVGASVPLMAQDRVATVVAEARRALGGSALDSLKTLSAEGPFRRSMGQRDMEGTIALLLSRPDKLRRSEEMGMGGMVNGPTVERISGFDGTEAWDDIQNRGGMGGNMQMVIRGPGGPGGAGGPGGGALTEEQQAQARVRRMKMELQRWTVALLVDSATPFTDGGTVESPDGKADVLATTDEAGRPVKLFIDQATHLPVMLQYQEIRPRVMMAGGPGGRRGGPGGAPGGAPGTGMAGGPPAGGAPQGGGATGPDQARQRPSEEEMRQRIEAMRREGPPQPSQFAMYLADYKKVNGVLLPHRISVSIEGQPNEEWTVEKYRVNPSVKPAEFAKPKN